MAFVKSVFIGILFLILVVLFFIPNVSFAQTCGSATTTYVTGCNNDYPTCSARTSTVSYQCFNLNGVCSGVVNGWWCEKIPISNTCLLIQDADVTVPCGGGSGGCFLPGTIVNSSDGGKKIEDVKVGDKVDSFADNLITKSVVSKIYKVTRDYYYSLIAGNYRVKVTAEHPFFVGNNTFKEVKDLKAGDNVYVIEGGALKKKTVTSNKKIDEKTNAYNLSVDNTRTFFANGFAVHNKGTASYDGNHDGAPHKKCIRLIRCNPNTIFRPAVPYNLAIET